MKRFLAIAILAISALTRSGVAQMPGVVLQIDFDNVVFYYNDVTDYAKLATSPCPAAAVGAPFATHWDLGDIVAVNGKPAKGIWISRSLDLTFRPAPTPGQAIADAARGGTFDEIWDIYLADGTHVGGLMAAGTSGGVTPPGAPMTGLGANFTVIGGTGAFLGARGQRLGVSFLPNFKPIRRASIAEDPANRLALGGSGPFRVAIHLLPLMRPQVESVLHSDFTPVTASNPARAGELLILSATGLGPTRPGVEPEQPFPSVPLQEINSPVEVRVNGVEAATLNKIGWPGTTARYRLDFRVPDSTQPGLASVQLNAAWIPGPETQFPVR
jgi:hypothetical protein